MVAGIEYHEESVLAGIAVGRDLKGWSAFGMGNNSEGGELSEIVVRSGVADFIEVPADGFYGIGKVTVEGDADLVPPNIKYGVSNFFNEYFFNKHFRKYRYS